MRLLLIDNYDSFTFNLYHGLKPGFSFIKVMRNDDPELEQFDDFDAMAISPGPGLPREAGSLMFMLAKHSKRVPVLGICLGHQAIVEHFGGDLYNLGEVLHGKSRQCNVTDPGDPIYRNVNQRFMAGRYHSWVADSGTLPESLNVSARDSSGQVMSVRHRHLPVWGLQFHPESVLTPDGPEILKNWAESVKSYKTKP